MINIIKIWRLVIGYFKKYKHIKILFYLHEHKILLKN